MSFVKRFLAFWYDFIVGDDWFLAVGVIALLAAGGVLARAGALAADVLVVPAGVVVILAISLWRATA